MVLAASPRSGGHCVGCWRVRAGHQDSAGTAGWSFPNREVGRVKPELARIIGHFPELVIASRCKHWTMIKRRVNEHMANTPRTHHERIRFFPAACRPVACADRKAKTRSLGPGRKILVAGTGFEPVTFGL